MLEYADVVNRVLAVKDCRKRTPMVALFLLISVARLGDFLDFGQLFKDIDNNLICPNFPHS